MSQGTAGFKTLMIGATSWRVFTSNVVNGGIQVHVGELSDSRAAIMVAALRSMLSPLLIALPLLAMASCWSVRYGLGSLRRLGRAVAQREPHAGLPITMDEAQAEMRPLIDALNRLFERIAELLESERRFTADAAHELRTPIAAIRAQAQVALGEHHDDGQRQHALLATLQGCDRATHLVEQLLTLSRLETVSTERGAAVDLSEVARRAVADLVPLALEQRQGIEEQAAEACWLDGEPALLGVLVRNLVDYPIRYSPVGTSVLVEVTRDHSDIVLGVADGGPGLDEAQRRRLGEQLFSRARHRAERQCGLGWSIVRRIAAAHGASIVVGSSTGLFGLAVRVRFKADPRAT